MDLIFIDGDHRHDSVVADIKAWLPKLKPTGWISGHDYSWGDNVAPAVDGVFGKERVYSMSNIWYVIPENRIFADYGYKGSIPNNQVRKVYDCFIFFNELDVLEIRLNELYDVVDKFILCEARYTHQGNPKPLYFDENKDRFAKFSDKICHIKIEQFPPECKTTWDREHYQRNCMIAGLYNAQPNDVVILSDADEILSADTVRNYSISQGICSIKMPLYYYKLDWRLAEPWFKPRIFPFSAIGKPTQDGFSQRGTLQWFRGEGDYQVQNQLEGGWHFSFMGDKESIRAKIKSYAHEEFNSEGITNDKNIEEAIEQGRDVFGRVLVTEGNKRVSAGTKTIAVKALPEAGKPADFSGAVGNFDFKVTPTKTNLKNGESLDLVVSVTGKGNMKLFNLPKPVVPNALEMYDPVHNEQVNTGLSGMTGKISDSY